MFVSGLSEQDIRDLHARYLDGEKPAQLAAEVGYKNGSSLLAAFRRYALSRLGTTALVDVDDPRAVRALGLWDGGATAKAAGEEVGLSQNLMTRLLRATGRDGQRFGENHKSWKGGRRRLRAGYVVLRVSADHPRYEMSTDRGPRSRGGSISEHRLVMAEHLGRDLLPEETVHHINGVRDDNRIENLELRTGHHGQGAAWRCSCCGSTELEPIPLAR